MNEPQLDESVDANGNVEDDKRNDDSDQCDCYAEFFVGCIAVSVPQSALHHGPPSVGTSDLSDEFVSEESQEAYRQANHQNEERDDFVEDLVVLVPVEFRFHHHVSAA